MSRINWIDNVKAYVFFSLASIALFYCIEGLVESISDAFMPEINMAYGVHGIDRILIHHNEPLWYFPFLVTTMIVTYLFVHFPIWLAWVMAILYASFSLLYSGVRLPWCLDIVGVGALFCFIGYRVNAHYDDVFKRLIECKKLFFLRRG
ncbi:MAG: hypothetical protein ACRBB3_04275 [Alphaproteobacteria bacterium]